MFINVRPAVSGSKGFFAADVSDANGVFHVLSGVWARNIEDAHIRFETIANDWMTFNAPSDEVMEAQTKALLAEIAIWGCE